MSDPSPNDVSPRPSEQPLSHAERSARRARRAQRHARQAEEGERRRQEAARQAREAADHNRLIDKFTRFDTFLPPDPSPEDWRQKALLFVEWVEEVAAQGLQGRLRERLTSSGGRYETDALADATDILDAAFAGNVEEVAKIMQAAQSTGGPYLRSLADCLADMGGMVGAPTPTSPPAETSTQATPAAASALPGDQVVPPCRAEGPAGVVNGRSVRTAEATPKNRSADNEADNSRKKRQLIPTNPDVLRLAKRIKDSRNKDRSMSDVALDFTEGNRKKADNLLRQLRRYPHLLI
jgi:hypothetical protein